MDERLKELNDFTNKDENYKNRSFIKITKN
jgi:hypothetical protein